MFSIVIEISVVLCAIFIIARLITGIIFLATMTSLISKIKQKADLIGDQSTNLVQQLNSVMDDLSSVTSMFNKKKIIKQRRKKEILIMRKENIDRIKDSERKKKSQ